MSLVARQKIYRLVFWVGYFMVLAVTFIPFKQDFLRHSISIVTFKFHLDQVLHAVVYLLICIYFSAGHYMGLTLFRGNSFKVFLILILALATVTEAVQIFVPARVFNFFDLIANVVGVGIGLVVIWVFGGSKR